MVAETLFFKGLFPKGFFLELFRAFSGKVKTIVRGAPW
jgi:hypothetical protein